MSFGTILVPLDGSELSDRILEQARRILVTQDARVVLLRVIPPRGEKEPDRAHQERRDAANAHLDRLRRGLKARGCEVSATLHEGDDPAQAIVEVAERERAGLVAMTTHGRTGPARWVRGSVAERVLRGCERPLFLVNPKAMADAPSSPGELRFERLLVPLDGSRRSASVLPLAISLARAFGAPSAPRTTRGAGRGRGSRASRRGRSGSGAETPPATEDAHRPDGVCRYAP